MPAHTKALIEKIQMLPAERIDEVEDLVDFIASREQKCALTRASDTAKPDLVLMAVTSQLRPDPGLG